MSTFYCLFGCQEQAGYVQIEVFSDVFVRNRFKRRKFVDAGIVHKHIYVPKLLLDLRKQSLDVLRVGNVPLNRNRLAAFLVDSGDDRIGAILAVDIVCMDNIGVSHDNSGPSAAK